MTDILARQRQLVGSSAEWGANDLVIGNGEIAVERVSATEIKIKIGDGVNKFSLLPYVAGGTTNPSLLLTGGTMTGPIVLPAGAPTGLQALAKDEADKLYVLVADLLAASAGAASANKVPKLNAAGKLDASFLSISGGMNFKGNTDPTAAPPAAAAGDFYFATKNATLGAGWTGIVGAAIETGDSLLFDGANWHSLTGVADLTGYVPTTGGTVTGPLHVIATPNAATEATSKGYVDTELAKKAGGDKFAPDFIQNAAYNAGDVIWNVTAKQFEMANKNIAGGSPKNAGDWGALGNVFNEFVNNYEVFVDRTTKFVGIGTNQPTAKLDVVAPTGVIAKFRAAGGGTAKIESTPGAVEFTTVDADASYGTSLISGATKVFAGGTERMRITADGRVGIGTNAPNQTLQVNGNIMAGNGSASNPGYNFVSSTATGLFTPDGYTIGFSTNGSESMRVDSSGNLLVGATSPISGGALGVSLSKDANGGFQHIRSNLATTHSHIVFYNPNGNVGSIQTTGSATAYVTSSDYRLKENITPMTGALAKVAQLNPVNYTWKVDGTDGHGFIAHELQAVVPECVSGAKDAVETYTDENGVEQTRPVYQGVDTSFLVGILTAAIKEQQAIIDDLKTRIKALEAA